MIARQALLGTVAVLALCLPASLAFANPTSCCALDPYGVAGASKIDLTLTLERSCLAAGTACPDAASIELLRDGVHVSWTWTFTQSAKRCVYGTVDAAFSGHHEYKAEIPYSGLKQSKCFAATYSGPLPDAGVPDRGLPDRGASAADVGSPADAAKLSPAGGGDGCRIGRGARSAAPADGALSWLLLSCVMLLIRRHAARPPS